MGFPMRCDMINLAPPLTKLLCFNPLWVFQCAATCYIINCTFAPEMVSIPYGFSNALRLFGLILELKPHRVSIPYGFSNALRLSCSLRALLLLPCFNPLWVFQCAATLKTAQELLMISVSIPYGFSNALRPGEGNNDRGEGCIVSIPYGFSNALRPRNILNGSMGTS